jgi:hypothetical protein
MAIASPFTPTSQNVPPSEPAKSDTVATTPQIAHPASAPELDWNDKSSQSGDTHEQTAGSSVELSGESHAEGSPEKQADSQLRLAKSLLNRGDKDSSAKKRLEHIIETYPDTPAGEEARKLLDKLTSRN